MLIMDCRLIKCKELPVDPFKYIQPTNFYECGSGKLPSYDCPLCFFKTDMKVNLSAHITMIHKRRRLDYNLENILKVHYCKHCDFYSFSLLIVAKHSLHQCPKKPPTTKKRLPQTLIIHQVPRIQSCQHCPYITTRRSNLIRHMVSQHQNLMLDKWFICEHCGYKTKTSTNLKIHLEVKHTNPEDVEWFKCDHCPHVTALKRNLRKHIKRNHADVPSSTSETVVGGTQQIKWFECEHCSYKAKDRHSVLRHVMAKHTDPKEKKWYKCDYCPKRSLQKGQLRVHVMGLHPDKIEGLKCSKCYFRTTDKSKLIKHALIQHPEKR